VLFFDIGRKSVSRTQLAFKPGLRFIPCIELNSTQAQAYLAAVVEKLFLMEVSSNGTATGASPDESVHF
jgi:hypothetical protein